MRGLPDPALHPVGEPGVERGVAPHVGEKVLRRSPRQRSPAKGKQRSAHAGASERHGCLERGRDLELVENGGDERSPGAGVAQDHEDVIRGDAGGHQARDLEADRLGLAAFARGLDQHQAVVGLDDLGACLEQVAVQVDQGGARAVAVVVRQPQLVVGTEVLAQLRHEPGAGGQRQPVLVVDRDRHLAGA